MRPYARTSNGAFARFFGVTFSTKTSRFYSTHVLRPYQAAAVEETLKHLNEGSRRVAISLPTGSGKTVVMMELIKKIAPLTPFQGEQVLILAQSRQIVTQIRETAERDAYNVGVEMGTSHASGNEQVIAASVQSLVRRIDKYDPTRFKLILVDEAHHAAASSYVKILKYFGAAQANTHIAVVGLSATMKRMDGLGLNIAFDKVSHHSDLASLLKEGYLSKLKFSTVEAKAHLLEGTQSLPTTQNSDVTNDLVVRTWRQVSDYGTKYKSTLIFGTDIEHVRDMTNAFLEAGIAADYVVSTTDFKERQHIIDQFKAGKFPVLINCGVFTEGADIPNIDLIIINTYTQSSNRLMQMIGRGLRLHEGKDHCHVVDMAGHDLKGLSELPTLEGIEGGDDPNGIVWGSGKRESQPSFQSGLSADTVQVTTFDDFLSLLLANPHEPDENRIPTWMSRNVWIRVKKSSKDISYHLDVGRDYIRIQEGAEGAPHCVFRYIENWDRSGHKKMSHFKHLVTEGGNARTILAAADKFVAEHYDTSLTHKYCRWRQLPATEAQINYIKKMLTKKFPLVPLDSSSSITRGDAVQLITKLKRGDVDVGKLYKWKFAKVEPRRRTAIAL